MQADTGEHASVCSFSRTTTSRLFWVALVVLSKLAAPIHVYVWPSTLTYPVQAAT